MATLPANLPDISKAKLPVSYEAAKVALAECAQIDECAKWADQAEVLASYAKQAGDETLRKTADRIQARAIRRCGELLRAIKPSDEPGRPRNNGVGAHPISRSQAASDAGLSRHQKRDALRVAKIPTDAFERAVESDDPPTVTRLATSGKAPRPLVDLKGRDPHEFALSTQAQGHLRRLVEFCDEVKPEAVARGAMPKEWTVMKGQITKAVRWLERLAAVIEKERA